jgi:hypothetical protein
MNRGDEMDEGGQVPAGRGGERLPIGIGDGEPAVESGSRSRPGPGSPHETESL